MITDDASAVWRGQHHPAAAAAARYPSCGIERSVLSYKCVIGSEDCSKPVVVVHWRWGKKFPPRLHKFGSDTFETGVFSHDKIHLMSFSEFRFVYCGAEISWEKSWCCCGVKLTRSLLPAVSFVAHFVTPEDGSVMKIKTLCIRCSTDTVWSWQDKEVWNLWKMTFCTRYVNNCAVDKQKSAERWRIL